MRARLPSALLLGVLGAVGAGGAVRGLALEAWWLPARLVSPTMAAALGASVAAVVLPLLLREWRRAGTEPIDLRTLGTRLHAAADGDVAAETGDDAVWLARLDDGSLLRSAAFARTFPADEQSALTRLLTALAPCPRDDRALQRLLDLARSLLLAPLSATARRTLWHRGVVRTCANAAGDHRAAALVARCLPAMQAPTGRALLADLATPEGLLGVALLGAALPWWIGPVILLDLTALLLGAARRRMRRRAVAAFLRTAPTPDLLLRAFARLSCWPGLPARLAFLAASAWQGGAPARARALVPALVDFDAVHHALVASGAASLGGPAIASAGWMTRTALAGTPSPAADAGR